MNNYNISLSNNQHKSKTYCNLAQTKFDELLERFDSDTVVFKILNYLLLSYKRHNGRVFPAQQTIANYVKCTREHVNRVIKMLFELGLIRKKRIQYTSCSYWLHPMFHDNDFRWKFKDILPALRWSPRFQRMRSKLAWGLKKATTQITLYYNNYYYPTGNNNNYLISKNSYSSSSKNYENKQSKDDSRFKKPPVSEIKPLKSDSHFKKPIVYEMKDDIITPFLDKETKLSLTEQVLKERPDNSFLQWIVAHMRKD